MSVDVHDISSTCSNDQVTMNTQTKIKSNSKKKKKEEENQRKKKKKNE
jgi:hypothetical protein